VRQQQLARPKKFRRFASALDGGQIVSKASWARRETQLIEIQEDKGLHVELKKKLIAGTLD
jgi:hypothetical protein